MGEGLIDPILGMLNGITGATFYISIYLSLLIVRRLKISTVDVTGLLMLGRMLLGCCSLLFLLLLLMPPLLLLLLLLLLPLLPPPLMLRLIR